MNLLLKVRLSYYFVGLFLFFGFISFVVDGTTFSSAALTLFSVNSFLYGFYIAPILSGQKSRIDELQKIIRAEANALFSMILKTKKLPDADRNELQSMTKSYILASNKQRKAGEGEKEYEALITYCLDYKGKESEKIDKILDSLVANQANRSSLSMQLNNKVFNNEWWVILVLFGITLSFIIFIDIGDSWQMNLVQAFLCTGLTMLLVILMKLSTLTHKKAKQLWDPMNNLASSEFHKFD